MMSLFKSMQSMGQTDGRGQFAIRNVAEGTYTLRVFMQGYADGRVDRVRVSRGNTDAGEVGLERGIAFRVHVTSPDRKPLAGAMVLLRDERGSLVGLIVIFHGVPTWAASTHQAVGVVILALAVSIYHQTRPAHYR